jgi:hypothetical protein
MRRGCIFKSICLGALLTGTAVSSAAILFHQIVKAATGFVPAF